MKTHFDKICMNVVYRSISYYTILLYILDHSWLGFIENPVNENTDQTAIVRTRNLEFRGPA